MVRSVPTHQLLSMRSHTQFLWETYFNSLERIVSTTLEVCYNAYTKYTHAHQVPHADHMEMAKLEALATRHRAVLRLSVYESASKVNHSGGDAQVVSCRHCLVKHPFVEQLIVFHTSGLVLMSSSILNLDLHPIVRWHPERHVPKST